MGRGYNTLETDDKDEATNQETGEMDGLWVTYRILVMCTGEFCQSIHLIY